MLAIDVLEGDHACRLAARDERDEEDRLRRLAGHDNASVSLGLGVEVLGDQQRLARLQHMLREADKRTRLGLQPVAPFDHVRVVDEPARVVERRDRDDLRIEHVPDPVADRVVDRLRIELARDRVLHAVDQRQLGVPLPRLVHQTRVLERHAQAAGERLQQLLVRLAECVLIEALQRDQTHCLAAAYERNEEDRLRLVGAGNGGAPVPLSLGVHVLDDQQRLFAFQHVLRETARCRWFALQPLTALDHVRGVQEPRRLVECSDPNRLGVEDLLNLVADRVVDRLRIELARDRVLHAVDQRELRVPLPRLVHQPRVLERHAQTAGERLQQLLVRLAERVLAIDVLERDHPRCPARGDERNEQDRLRRLADDPPRTASTCVLARDVLVDQQRLPRLEHVPANPVGGRRLPLLAARRVRSCTERGLARSTRRT